MGAMRPFSFAARMETAIRAFFVASCRCVPGGVQFDITLTLAAILIRCAEYHAG